MTLRISALWKPPHESGWEVSSSSSEERLEGAAFWDPSDLRCWAGDMLKPASESSAKKKEDRITNWWQL
ncbi:hypothetical protein Pst134EB_014736 [Puccinia striiformis f. sp. tritici]|nr:hypothetical protein Pst134EB_014736 [Puccinia striiformis f. sp. tritici]